MTGEEPYFNWTLLAWVQCPEPDVRGIYWTQRMDGYWHVRIGRHGRVVNQKGVRYERAIELARECSQRTEEDDGQG